MFMGLRHVRAENLSTFYYVLVDDETFLSGASPALATRK